jgi:hypothetical protein
LRASGATLGLEQESSLHPELYLEASEPMLVEVRVDQAAARLWHLRLIERLNKIPGVLVGVSWGGQAQPLPNCISLLFLLEQMINGLPSGGLAEAAPQNAFLPYVLEPAAKPDVVLDLCGSAETSAKRWYVTFDGSCGEAAALGALLLGRAPVIGIIDAHSGMALASGRPGTEANGIILSAFEDCLARVITLVVSAIRGGACSCPNAGAARLPLRCGDVGRFAMKMLVGFVVRRLYILCTYGPHWRVGWRFVEGPDTFDLLNLPAERWNVLRDDVCRFYADPFPFSFGGRMVLFVEEFDHRVGRGAIAAVEFDAQGPRGAPRTVLATTQHLSYPFVFEHAGEVWMTPESSAARRIDLYRAVRFPDSWQLATTLVAGIDASDPTLAQYAGRWWMMATVREEYGSFSDALYLWSATDLFGPWIPHQRNPVLVDIASARPAGRIVERGGRLLRPAQDCRGGYGRAVTLAEITRLDDDGFTQSILGTLRAGALWPGRRLHTLNRAGSLECIDGSACAVKIRGELNHWLGPLIRRDDDSMKDAAPVIARAPRENETRNCL